jgi:hypothetical protein
VSRAGGRQVGTKGPGPPVTIGEAWVVEVVAVRAVVVYESLFGNTHKIASAVSDGLRSADPSAEVTLVDVTHADPTMVASADMLVVGAPTHMHGLSTGWSRRVGVSGEQKKAGAAAATVTVDPAAEGPGVRDFLKTLPKPSAGARAAAFDTRAAMRLAGGAARPIARHLSHAGYHLAASPAGFIIEDTQGPLRAGEEDRARTWGADLVR